MRRLLALPVVALGVTLLTFSVMHLMPGDPAELIARGKYGEEVTAEEIERVRKAEGFDAPFPVQYGKWLTKVGRGELGRSVVSRRPVLSEIAARLPATCQLAVAALVISVFIGLPMGLLCGARKGTIVDDTAMAATMIGVSMPSFWLALLLILVFALYLGWLPSLGSDGIRHLILPAVTLGVGLSALTTRLTRASTVDVLYQGYIRTARAKGLSGPAVMWKHALKNALIPVVTVTGLQFGRLLEGAVIVETIFGRPGVGRLLVRSILARDFAVVQGCVLTMAAVFVTVNLGVDLLYACLDPRIRYDTET